MTIQPFVIDFEKYIPEITDQPIGEVVKSLFDDRYPPEKINLIIRYLVKSGSSRFSSKADLDHLRLPLPTHNAKMTYAHAFASCGYRFTIPEINILSNHPDEFEWTVAHHMALSGCFFTMEELQQIGNPADKWGNTVAHFMASRGYVFTVPELKILGNPSNTYHRESVAHWMGYFQGYKFSEAELESLGNPKDDNGRTPNEVNLIRYRPQPSMLLFLKEGEPFFAQEKNFGRKLHVNFGVEDLNREFHEYANFVISIQQNEMGWNLEFGEREASFAKFHVYDHLYWKIVVLTLYEKLNQAMSERMDLDFSEYETFLNDLAQNAEVMFWVHN